MVNVRAARKVRAAPGRGGSEQWVRYWVIAVCRSREGELERAVVHQSRNFARAVE